MSRPRNVLFITADQWRGDCLSALGHPVVETPHLDALAAQGVLFKRHFANTVPCSPSRATLHTGLYQHNHRVTMNGTPLDRRHRNWAQVARAAGYDPVLIGYTDQTVDPREVAPDDPRLKTYEGVLPGLRGVAATSMDHPGPWADYLKAQGYTLPEEERFVLWLREAGPDFEDGADSPKPWVIKTEHSDTTWHVDRAMDYVSQNKTQSWVLHLSLFRPHPPWIASEPWNTKYDPARVPSALQAPSLEQESAQHQWLAYQLRHPLYQAPDDVKKLQRLRAVYFGMMSEVDQNLGRLFDHMKREGLWDDTLIIFTSDHGEQLGDHWLLGKCGYFDQSYHVPMIVRAPGNRADFSRDRTLDEFSEHVDVMPTMLEYLGLPVPEACDGRSLFDLLVERENAPWRQAAHWEYDFRDASFDGAEQALGLTLHQCNLSVVRDDRYKFVHFAKLEPLLFDLQKDPGEFTNLAQDPSHLHITLNYTRELLSWRQIYEDQTLTHLQATEKGMIARAAARG